MQEIETSINGFRRLSSAAPRRVAVFRALQLGDLLCAVPAFRALRSALPHAHIALIGLPWARNFVDRLSHYFDGFWEFPGWPGLPEREPVLESVPAFLDAMQRQHFDLVIQMHGSGLITNPLVGLFGARHFAGFYLPGNYCPDPQGFLPYPERLPEVWKHLRLMEFLGYPSQGEDLEFALLEADIRALNALLEEKRIIRGEYVCIHPGARASARCWPPASFAAVADALAAEGFTIVLTGTKDEVSLTGAVAHAMRAPCVDLTGRTELGEMAALLDASRLLICNDTGVSHLAAARRVPSVVVFHRLSETEGWPPRNRQLHRVVTSFSGVSPERVLAEVGDLLRQTCLRRAESVSNRRSSASLPPVAHAPGSPQQQEQACAS